MELVIDFDKIEDSSKREWLISSLKLMNIDFQTVEKRPSLDQYNQDLFDGEAEIARGEYITATDLKAEANKWK